MPSDGSEENNDLNQRSAISSNWVTAARAHWFAAEQHKEKNAMSAQMSVAQFATELKMPPLALIEQLAKSGVVKQSSSDLLTEQDKTCLLDFLRKSHGETAPKTKVILSRHANSVSESKTAITQEVFEKRQALDVGERQELQIVRALSSVDIPKTVLHENNINELIGNLIKDQDDVQSAVKHLEYQRWEQKDSNLITNVWNGRSDRVQDAQLELNKSIGKLTESSSKLLVVNCAISKVLSDQQRILLEQQNLLKLQADELAEQNLKILDQQTQLAEQQKAINAANQGLMEAKGVTQEQAQKLVGCVKRVEEAESQIGVANEELRTALEQRMDAAIDQCIVQLNVGMAELDQRHNALTQELTNSVSDQSQCVRAELEKFSGNSANFRRSINQQLQSHVQSIQEKIAVQDAAARSTLEAVSTQMQKSHQDVLSTVEQQLLVLNDTIASAELKFESVQRESRQELDVQHKALERNNQHLTNELHRLASQLANLSVEQQKNARVNRLALGVAGCVTLVSIGWQFASRFLTI